MLGRAHYFYRPVENLSLILLVGDNSTDNISPLIIEDLDLYYQPLEKPSIATVFAFLRVIIVIFSLVIHFKLYKMIKNASGILKNVTNVFICTQMIYLPVLVMFIIATDFIYPLSSVIGKWFCTFGWLVFLFGSMITTSHSFIAALMRYFFIVREEKIRVYGKEKAKKIFLYLFVSIPLIMVITGAIDGTELTWMSFTNKCYGIDHRIFLIKNSINSAIEKKIISLDKDESNTYLDTTLAVLWRIYKILRTGTVLFMGFNISEGILYFKILSHLNRIHTETMAKLRKTLSKSMRSRRNRRHVVNIQITILAWLTESFAFLLIFLGSFILRNQNIVVTLIMQTLTFFCYFVLVPSILLINDSDTKGYIIESKWYVSFLSIFHWEDVDEIDEQHSNSGENCQRNDIDDVRNDGNEDCQNLYEMDPGAAIEEERATESEDALTINDSQLVTDTADVGNFRICSQKHQTLIFLNDCEIIDIETCE